MKFELNKTGLYWELYDAAEKYEEDDVLDLSDINSKVLKYISNAETCIDMILNRKRISNEQFYDMLLSFADIYDWDFKDSNNVINLYYNQEFITKDIRIYTTMHQKRRKTEGSGRDISWWTEDVAIILEIRRTKDTIIDESHIYTVEEIQKLIDEKKIVIIREYEMTSKEYYDVKNNRFMPIENTNFKTEEYHKFDYVYNDYYDRDERVFFNKDKQFYPYTLKYIRKIANKRKLLKLYKEYLEFINDSIFEVTNDKQYERDEYGGGDESFKIVTEKYNKQFNKQGYAKRLKKLNDFISNK